MNKTLLAILLCACCVRAHAADYYWVGGTGVWSDVNHWATVSGGNTHPSIVPSSIDDVHFDANSGLVASTIVDLPTSVHAYCRNMTWSGIAHVATQNSRPLFRNSSSTQFLYISGNLELSGSVIYGIQRMSFEGTTPATFRTNGALRVNVAGWYNPFNINKAGSTLTLLDAIPAGLAVTGVTLTAGTLDIAGQTQTFENFTSSGNLVRNVNMTNANLTINGTWNYTGTNKSISNTGSNLTTAVLITDGLYYPKVDITTASSSNFSIYNTSFGQLTYTNPAASNGSVRIQSGNTISRLEFKGDGLIRNGNNTIDTLIGAPGKQLNIWETNTVNKYFSMKTPACSGLATLTGGNPSLAVLNFGASAVTDLQNVYIDYIKAVGTGAPYSVVGADGDTSVGFSYSLPAAGTTLYWIGGSGDWNDIMHWSAASGGAGGYCVPIMTEDVVFDANSGFTTGSKTVTTSVPAWCKNMSWTGVANAPVFNESSTYKTEIWGNLIMDNTVTMNADPIFRGPDVNTLTTNGSGLGTFHFTVNKAVPTGSITLTDNLINNTTDIRLNSGGFLLPGRTMQIRNLVSSAGQRTMDITNATITTQQGWSMTGVGRTWVGNAVNSFITTYGGLNIDGLIYPKIHVYGLNSNSVYNATIGELIFQNPSPTSLARIHTGNTITNLEFKGAGGLVSGNNTITNLTLAPSRNYFSAGTNIINGTLTFNSPACSGLGELRGLNDAVAAFAFGPSAVTNMANVYLQNITATGTGTPVAITGADAGGNTGFTFSSATGGNRYWVGGSGDWNDASHWSLTSGGAGGACIPIVQDDVFFDAASFTSGSNTVTTTVGNAYCRNMSWAGATNAPVFNESASFNLEVWGDMIMNPTVTMNATVNFMGTSNTTLTTNGSMLGNFDFIIDKPSGSIALALADNLSNNNTDITLKRGTFNAPFRTLSVTQLAHGNYTLPSSLNIANATFNGSLYYNTNGTRLLNAAGSTINAARIGVDGGDYNIINITGGNGNTMSIANISAASLTFTNTDPASGANINAGNNIGTLEFKSRGFINGNNTINTLIFSPGKVYTLAAGSNTTVTGSMYGSGTPCNSTEINSSSTTANATITKASGTVDLDYIRLRRVNAAGGATFRAREHSQDIGNVAVTGWNIAPYNTSAPIYGLGPDTSLPVAAFPHVLHTSGFFGSPLSQYLWSNNSTLDSFVADTPGTYGVTVSFPDGCTISDNITLSRISPLPVTLNSFTVSLNNCSPELSWNVADARNFDHFEIERSEAGTSFIQIASVGFRQNDPAYTYLDNEAAGEGTYYYRLKMVDLNGESTYSSIAAIRKTCNNSKMAVRVYPTITEGDVHLSLSEPGQTAQLSLMDMQGRELFTNQTSVLQSKVNLSRFPSGTYLLRVTTNDQEVYWFRLIHK